MKRLLFLLLLFTSSVLSFAQVHVRGYYRKNGTYVQPHQRTRPNHTVTDNYSYPGNYNPNTKRITGGSTKTYNLAIPTPTEYGSYTTSQNTHHESSALKDNNATFLTTDIATPVVQLYAVVQENTALKSEPSYTANSKYAIPKGSIVKVSKHNDNYYSAEVDGRIGYVCTCQIKKTFTKP